MYDAYSTAVFAKLRVLVAEVDEDADSLSMYPRAEGSWSNALSGPPRPRRTLKVSLGSREHGKQNIMKKILFSLLFGAGLIVPSFTFAQTIPLPSPTTTLDAMTDWFSPLFDWIGPWFFMIAGIIIFFVLMGFLIRALTGIIHK